MSSSFSDLFDQYNYFVWPNSTTLASTTWQSADTIDALFITNRSPAYVSSNCSCNGFKSYFTTATPSSLFTFGAWGIYSVNGTEVLFDTTIDQSCSGTGAQNTCFLTLHDDDGFGYNGWGTPLATLGYFQMNFNGQGVGQGTLPVAYAVPKPTTYIYPPVPTATTTASSSTSSGTSSTSISVATISGPAITSAANTVTESSTATTIQALGSSTAIPAVSSSHSKSISKGVIAGVAVGASLVFLLALLGLFLLFRGKKKTQQEDFQLAETKTIPTDKSASDVALVERLSTTHSPRSPSPTADKAKGLTISPEALRDFIAAASLDHRTVLDPPVMLRFPGEELSALICNIWDAIAVRETYVSRLSPSINIPTTLESLRKQANEISKRIGVPAPFMLSVTSTWWKGDTVGWSEADRFKHTFAFSGATDGVIKKRLIVRRGESIGDGKKFETHETWAVGNCTECQSYLGATPVIKASMTIYVADGNEVEACARCKELADNFKKLHGIQSVDPGAEMAEKEQKRAELARQAVEREWERMEEEYRTREMGAGGGIGKKRNTAGPSRLK